MGRRFVVLGIHDHHAFADGDAINAFFLQQNHHVFHHAGCGNDAPFGKRGGPGPEDDIGLDEYGCAPGQVIQAAGKFNDFSNGFQGLFITDNGNTRLYHQILLYLKAATDASSGFVINVFGLLSGSPEKSLPPFQRRKLSLRE